MTLLCGRQQLARHCAFSRSNCLPDGRCACYAGL